MSFKLWDTVYRARSASNKESEKFNSRMVSGPNGSIEYNQMAFEYFIGRRYLRAKQKQAFISLITILSTAGVAVGVMALIVVIAVMSGFESDLKSRILGGQAHIEVKRHGSAFTDYRRVLEFLKTVEENISLTESHSDQIENKIASIPGIVLGRELAKNLGVGKGDLVYLISSRGMLTPIGHIPAMKQFRVTDFFKSGMYDFDQVFAYVHIKDAQRILRMGNSVSAIEVRVRDIYRAKAISEQIASGLGFPYWAWDWMRKNQNLFTALKLERIVMFIILTLIILVAAFNIASTLIMMVMGKTKDIAILKAMGATDKSIRKIFVFKGMVIGTVGTTFGLCLGFVLCTVLKHYNIHELTGDIYYFTTKLPVKLEFLDVFFIASSALIICFLATLYPARQASRLNPVEAIRYG
jgi:lipoprotein-releasing system permease protein